MCLSAANYLINEVNKINQTKSNDKKIVMTSKRLQKMLYFSEIKYMLDNDGDSMFVDEFYAWPSGPVIPAIYQEFMQYQKGEMQPKNLNFKDLTDKMKSALEYVIKNTEKYDTIELVGFSHVENGPWANIYEESKKNLINKNSIFDYYSKKGMPF